MEETTFQSVIRRCQTSGREEPPMDAEQRIPALTAEEFAREGEIQQVGPQASTMVTSPGQHPSPIRPLLSDRQAHSAAIQSP